MEEIEKARFAFSKLVEINSRRSLHYTAVADRVKKAYLKTIFMNYAFQAQQLNVELTRWLHAYGIKHTVKTENFMGITWERVKNMISIESENNIYTTCELFEEECVRGYSTAIALSFIPVEALKDVKKHMRDIEKVRDTHKSMRENNLRHIKVA